MQDPAECLYDGMPTNAIRGAEVDDVLTLAALAERLAGMASRPAADAPPAALSPAPGHAVGEREATRFTCPDCGGVLFEERAPGAQVYACSVGHSYALESLQEEQGRQLESALWAAVRSLEDRAVLLRRMAGRSGERGQDRARSVFESQADDAARRADMIRGIVAQPAPQTDAA